MKYLKQITLLSIFILFGCNERDSSKELSRLERKKARTEYFFNKLKDPKTNEIPENIRVQELVFASDLRANNSKSRTTNTITHTWNEIGPSDIGGRTRAIAQDFRNSDIVLAGGVSGGIWKSVDGGQSWKSKLPEGSNLSVTSIAQDTISGDVWYATSGEVSEGGTAGGKFSQSYYLGVGIYKSIDNGDSWELMTYEKDSSDPDVYNKQSGTDERISSFLRHPFNLTSKVIVANFNAAVIFITTQYQGIWASTDGGDSFFQFASSLINNESPNYSDLIIDKDGVITIWFGPTDSANNGIYRSYDGGGNFYNVTPNDYPVMSSTARAIFAESRHNPEIVYAFFYDGSAWDAASHLYRFNYANLSSAGGTYNFLNRSANLPSFSRSIFGGEEGFTTQGGYDMTLAVHPNDPDLVVLGYVDLIKSEDGFASSPTSDPAKYWIGGNENPWRQDEDISFENTHHADQHLAFFDYNNPDVLWSGHDGGISKTQNIRANRVQWESLNNDYNVTQFYTVATGIYQGESYVLGGTQDNGTPLLDHSSFGASLMPSVGDITSGDGSYCYANGSFIYSSVQNGVIVLFDLTTGLISRNVSGWIERDDLNRFFIHPFTVDPNDEGTLFYGSNGDGIIARNDQFDEASSASGFDINLINNSWFDVNIGDPVAISALKVTDLNPSHKLYFGGSLNGDPVLYTWDNANTTGASSIGGRYLTEVPSGTWLNDIAVNSLDGSELILVYSNYNIDGLFHSSDGGETFVSIEGNLGNNDHLDASGISGPSLRAAEIIEDASGNKKYYVATSIGLFSTETLNGSGTVWALETGLLDNIVIEDLDYRREDGALAIGTHGRGIFMGEMTNTNSNPSMSDQSFAIQENSSTGTVIGSIEASDPDDDVLSYSITSGNNDDYFELTTSGELSVNIASGLDFETAEVFTLIVKAEDGNGGSATASVAINVTNVNESPEIVDQSFTIDENSANGFKVGAIEGTDPEGDDLTFEISGEESGSFSIDSSTGELFVNNNELLDFEVKNSFVFEVTVSDAEFTALADIIVQLNDVNEGEPLAVTDGNEIRIYPNPVTDKVFVSGLKNKAEYKISNVSGKILREGFLVPDDGIELSGFSKGIYFLVINSKVLRIQKE